MGVSEKPDNPSKAWELGAIARASGGEPSANPYRPEILAAQHWREGWEYEHGEIAADAQPPNPPQPQRLR